MLRKTVCGIMLTLLFIGMLTLAFNIQPVKQAESTTYELASANGYVNVNVSEAKQMIESNPDLVILDVRTLEEYESGHIENAVLIPVSELEGRLDELDKVKETLVYCRSGGRSATASQILVDTGFSSVYNMLSGLTAWRDAGYWIEIIHEGDLIIDGTQTFVIENCTYIQIGNIYVRDYGKLIIRNTIFVVNQTYMEQYGAIIEGYGSLEIENSEIDRSIALDAYIGGFSKVTIKHARVTWAFYFSGQSITIINSTFSEFTTLGFEWRNSYISVVNSTIGVIGIYFYADYVVTVDDLKPNLYQSWEFRQDASYLILENTRVTGWKLCFFSNSIVTVTNSELHNVELQFHDSVVEINGVKPGRYGFWNLQTNESVKNVSYDLTLKNTSVEHWTIVVSGSSKVDIWNTTAIIGAFVSHLGKVHIENSTVDCLHISGNAERTIINSRIIRLWFQEFHGNAFFNKTEVEIGSCVVHHSDFYLSGDFTFIPRNVEFSYVSSYVTRNYNVIVRDAYGQLVSNTNLTLKSKDGISVWNGSTDFQGRADFNLTFTDSNYTDALNLEAVKGDVLATMNISFISDTPVILTLRYFADLNGDGTVNIMDIALVAKAYGSKPGDENWNEIADMDKNGEIDIIDIATVAKDYGKTV